MFHISHVIVQCRNFAEMTFNYPTIGLPFANIIISFFGVLLDYSPHYMFKDYIL